MHGTDVQMYSIKSTLRWQSQRSLILTNMLLDEITKERQGVGGLDGRVLIQIAKGVGSSPTWHHSFPWISWMFRNNIIIPLYI